MLWALKRIVRRIERQIQEEPLLSVPVDEINRLVRDQVGEVALVEKLLLTTPNIMIPNRSVCDK